jgi:single-strand DNA-binding protein
MYLNKVILIGNLTQDPELKSLPSGNSVTSFGLATNRTWSDQNGQKQESVEYHNVVAYGKQADIISQYLQKGSLMSIEGRLQTRSWDGQDGQKRYKTEIVIENFQMGPRNAGSSTGSSRPAHHQTGQTSQPKTSPKQLEEIPTVSLDEEEINLEEIPF